MLRTHPKIVGVKGRKGERGSALVLMCLRALPLFLHQPMTHDRVCTAMLAVAQCHKAKPLCNEAAYTNARTQSHVHAHTPTRAHNSKRALFFLFFLQRPCVGMVIEGWQLADRLQTLFFDIKRFSSESHFHAFSRSRSRARAATHAHACTRKHNNAHFL